MKYRRFGKTELMLPVITCGCMRFQQSFNASDAVTPESQKNVEACVHRSLELGIHHFETARGYGTSEAQLGKVLPKLPRHEILVQTKVNPDADLGKFTANFDDSMKRLNLDYLDIFSIHGINDEEMFEQAMRCYDVALKWKDQGRVRHIGFASHGPTDIIVKAIQTDAFESVNLHWFYIQQEHWSAVQEAAKRDMGVYIISPNDKGGMLYKPTPKIVELTAPLHPMAFNDLYCLVPPEVHSLSCGVSVPGDFDLHVDAAEQLDRAAELTAPIVERLDAELALVLGADWMATWRDGLPEWRDTPGGINIPVILRLRNLALAFGMIEYGKMRYNLIGNAGNWFPGQNCAKLAEVDLTECLKRSPNAARIPAALREIHELLAGESVKRLQKDE